MKRKEDKVAFTLAEVLITLGIIGIVAALTMPSLIQNYKNQVVETRLKKFYNVMNQAIRLSEIDNGPAADWTLYLKHTEPQDGEEADGNGTYINRNDEIDVQVTKYLLPYLNIVKKENIDGKTIYCFSDGSAFSYRKTNGMDIAFYPKNPRKCLENEQVGSCDFYFVFYPKPDSNVNKWKYHYNKYMEPYMFAWSGDVDELYTGSVYSCDDFGSYCTKIIQHNGWKIPKNYPKRITF